MLNQLQLAVTQSTQLKRNEGKRAYGVRGFSLLVAQAGGITV